MKVVVLLFKSVDNDSRVQKEIRSLIKAGHNVLLVSTGGSLPPAFKSSDARLVVRKIRLAGIEGLGRFGTALGLVQFAQQVAREVRIWDPEVIHCHDFPTLPLGLLAARLTSRARVVYDSHDLFVDQPDRADASRIVRRLIIAHEKFLAKRACAVIQTTEGRARQFRDYYGIAPVVIMNKPLHHRGARGIRLPDSLRELRNGGERIVGYVGGIKPHRGLEQLVAACDEVDDVQIVLLGPAKYEWSRAFLDRYRGRVTWIPPVPVEAIVTAVSAFDIGVSLVQNSCLSDYLSCPTKVHELAAAGVPQVASDFPEIRRLLVDNPVGPIGMVVDPADVSTIRRAIERMLGDEALSERLRLNCAALRSRLTWDSEERKLLDLYRRLSPRTA